MGLGSAQGEGTGGETQRSTAGLVVPYQSGRIRLCSDDEWLQHGTCWGSFELIGGGAGTKPIYVGKDEGMLRGLSFHHA